jgi:hypothetical protein
MNTLTQKGKSLGKRKVLFLVVCALVLSMLAACGGSSDLRSFSGMVTRLGRNTR